jgi:predicted nucleic acid-binding protein
VAKLVIDASLAATWCFPDEQTDFSNGVLRLVGETIDLVAPTLWAYEIRNAVLMGLKRNRIDKEGAETLLALLSDLDVELSEPPSYHGVFGLAETYGLTFYDAAYLDLALRERSPIATLDEALRRAAIRAGVAIFSITPSP